MVIRKGIVGIMLIVIAAAAIFFIDSTPPASQENVFLQCETMKDKDKRYGCYNEAALYAMQNGKSIDELAQYALDPSSHLKQHAIGRAMFITSGYNLKSAEKKCAPNCSGPYLHAFSEEWGKYAPSRESEFVEFLNSICPFDKAVGCYHNIGHFYWSSNANFQESMALCNKLADTDRFYECAMGVIHEQFIQTDGKDFFQLCKNETNRRKDACFTIGSKVYPQWLSHELTGENPLKLCNEVSGEIPAELNYCYASAAWTIENKGRTLDLAWCNHLNAQLRELCAQGLRSPQPFWHVLCRLEGGSQCGE